MAIRIIRLWRDLLTLSWRRAPGLTALMMGLYTVQVSTALGTALVLRALVDAALDGPAQAAMAAAAAAALLYAFTAAVQEVFGGLLILAVERIGLTDLQDRIHHALVSLDGLEHLERPDYLDRITVVRGAAWGLMLSLWTAVGGVFIVAQLVVTLVLIGSLSPWLPLLAVAAAAPLWANHRGQRLTARAETATAEGFRLQRHLFDTPLQGETLRDVLACQAGPELARLQADAWRQTVSGRFRAQAASATWQLCGWALFGAAFTGALLLVSAAAVDGAMSAGSVVLAITLALSLIVSVQMAVQRTIQSANARRLIEPFLWLDGYAADERAGREAASADVPAVLARGIELREVSYRYPGTDRLALESVSVRLPAGSVVAVVGEYGSGKSTLVKLLQKFYRPTSGEIRVDDIPLSQIGAADWRARSTAAYQDFARFRTALSEAIGLGDLTHVADRGRVAAAARAAAVTPFAARLPQGLDTLLGRELGGVELSEGQWQRTALARAMMRQDPLLLLLDEPTASLDAPSELEIFRRFLDHARDAGRRCGAVAVIVSHRFSGVMDADLILVMSGGRLVESGTHKELMALGGEYAELHGLQEGAYQ
jgi:ABC-type multidrug transport system fused ATPase/permease subunit